jgi:preprotein translocase subunit SecY
LERGRSLYLLVYALLIFLFVFFFTAVVVKPRQRSDGRCLNPTGEAAKPDAVLTRLTLIGAFYLAILCIVPELMIDFFAIPFYLGGTSLLVTVLVGLDTLARVRARRRLNVSLPCDGRKCRR